MSIRQSHLKEYTLNYTVNPFDNKVIIIDEAHNFVSRIVNKINKNIKSSMFGDLYEYLKSADNCKIIFLSGLLLSIIQMKLLFYLIC